jgi:hypothetical protein
MPRRSPLIRKRFLQCFLSIFAAVHPQVVREYFDLLPNI